ncbi:MAG: sulfotransferase [Pseudomonadota bacterium]
MTEATLVFGAGATKAGTGWLYEYLAAHPECHFRSIKELHYFDALDWGTVDREIHKHEERQSFFVHKVSVAGGSAIIDFAERLRDRTEWLNILGEGEENVASYLDYLERGRTQEKIIGDITPAYGLLAEERLRNMAGLRDEVRFIFLMRDPVDRLWSHVRMMAVRRDPDDKLTSDRADRIFRRTLRGEEPQISQRSDYAKIVARLQRAAGDRLLVVFFEDLFRGGAIKSICAHLGIKHRRAPAGAVVHRGQRLEISPEQRRLAREWLAPQYDFAASQFTALPKAWHQSA